MVDDKEKKNPDEIVDEEDQSSAEVKDEETVEEGESSPSPRFKNTNSSSQIPSSGVYGSHKKSGGSKPLLIILVVLILVGVGFGTYFLREKFAKLSGEESSTPSPADITFTAPTSSPSPISVSSSRSKYNVRVLNGTSKAGLAASVSAKLKDLGYQTDKTGNATNSAFTRTVVRVKSTATGLFDMLVKDLSPDYDATSGGSLKDSDPVDGEVIIGTK